MKLILPLCLLLACLLHLAARFAGWKLVHLTTKPLLMPLLLVCYLLWAETASPAVVCALAFGFLGDVAMMVPQPESPGAKPTPALLAGLGAFFLGHVGYLAAFLLTAAAWPPLWVSGLALAGSLVLFALVFLSLRPHMGVMLLPGTAYLVILTTMVLAAAVTGIAERSPQRVLGGLLFLLSDYILARSILLGEKRYTHFWVMLTYLSAQVLLVLSLL